METMIPPQVGMRFWTKKKRPKKKRRPNKKREKNERKREKGQCYYPFTTLVLQSSTVIFMIESLSFSRFHILVGNSIIERSLYIPMMGFLKTATIPTYHGIFTAIPRYIAMQLSIVSFIMTYSIIVILLCMIM